MGGGIWIAALVALRMFSKSIASGLMLSYLERSCGRIAKSEGNAGLSKAAAGSGNGGKGELAVI